MNEEVKLEAKIPLFEEKELEIFDNNIHNIIEEYSKLHLEKREQILTQRIIIKQEEEIKKYKEVLNKIKEYIKNGNLRTGEMANLYAEKYILELLEEINDNNSNKYNNNVSIVEFYNNGTNNRQ